MQEMKEPSRRVVLINVFVVPTAAESTFMMWWRTGRMALGMRPGFVSARLLRSLDKRERYRFVNIVEWDSSENEKTLLAHTMALMPAPPIPGLRFYPELCESVSE